MRLTIQGHDIESLFILRVTFAKQKQLGNVESILVAALSHRIHNLMKSRHHDLDMYRVFIVDDNNMEVTVTCDTQEDAIQYGDWMKTIASESYYGCSSY